VRLEANHARIGQHVEDVTPRMKCVVCLTWSSDVNRGWQRRCDHHRRFGNAISAGR